MLTMHWRSCTTTLVHFRTSTRRHCTVCGGWEFNHVNLTDTLPSFNQHVTIPTQENNMLDCVYTNIRDTYRAISLWKARDAAFRSGDTQELRMAGRELTTDVKRAKATYAWKMQGHLSSQDPRSMWRRIKCIRDYNTRDTQCPRDSSLSEALHRLSACFEEPNTHPPPWWRLHKELSLRNQKVSLPTINTSRCIMKGPTHQEHTLFVLLPSFVNSW